MKKLKIECAYCKEQFERPKKEIDRQRRNGRNYFYCSRTCSGNGNREVNIRNLGSNIGDVSLFPPKISDGLSIFRTHMRRIKRRHFENNKDVTIDLEYLKDTWDKQDGKCAITAVPLVLEPVVTNPNYSASVDRIDSNKGYIKDNIQFISVTTNYAKNKYMSDVLTEYFDIIKNMGMTAGFD